MLTTLPASQHYIIEELGTSLTFVCPYRKNWLEVIALIISVVIYLLIGVPFVRQPVPSFETFDATLVLYLFAFAFLAVSVTEMIELLWQLVGREVVEVSDDHITIRHQVLGVGFARRFSTSQINSLFVSRVKSNWAFYRRGLRYFDFKRGRVAFNCGRTIWGGVKTFRFGTSLDEEEASQVVAVIHKRFPQYIYRGRTMDGA